MKNTKIFFMGLLVIIFTILGIPLINYHFLGKFTFSEEKALEYYKQSQISKLDCEWGVDCSRFPAMNCGCNEPPCKTYNIQGKNCVREGYTEKGFLGFTDFDTEYYVCEGYGRIALSCIDYFDSQEELEKIFKQ